MMRYIIHITLHHITLHDAAPPSYRCNGYAILERTEVSNARLQHHAAIVISTPVWAFQSETINHSEKVNDKHASAA